VPALARGKLQQLQQPAACLLAWLALILALILAGGAVPAARWAAGAGRVRGLLAAAAAVVARLAPTAQSLAVLALAVCGWLSCTQGTASLAGGGALAPCAYGSKPQCVHRVTCWLLPVVSPLLTPVQWHLPAQMPSWHSPPTCPLHLPQHHMHAGACADAMQRLQQASSSGTPPLPSHWHVRISSAVLGPARSQLDCRKEAGLGDDWEMEQPPQALAAVCDGGLSKAYLLVLSREVYKQVRCSHRRPAWMCRAAEPGRVYTQVAFIHAVRV
jgi:hypothetical protein